MTLTELQALLEDPDYIDFPMRRAIEKSNARPGWSTALAAILDMSIKTTIWECCAYTSLLFDTYGKNIQKVDFLFELPTGMRELYPTVRINGMWPASLKNSPLIEVCEQIDKKQVMWFTLGRIPLFGKINLAPGILTFIEHLNQDFTSAQQAREVAQTVAPEIEAFVRSWRLRQMTRGRTFDPDPTPTL